MSAMIWTVFGDKQQATEVASTLLNEKVIACANIMESVTSLFVWKDGVSTAQEVGVIFKLDESLLAKAVKRVEELHPYDTPAVMGWKCSEAADATRAWLGELAREERNGGNRQT